MKSITNPYRFFPLPERGPGKAGWVVLGAIAAAVLSGIATATFGIVVPLILLVFPVLGAVLAAIFNNPRFGLYFTIIYCFLVFFFIREVGGLSYGLAVDGLLIVTWIAVFFNSHKNKYEWPTIQSDLWLITLVWFIITLLELGNPAGASTMGWLQEMRGTTLIWTLAVPLSFILFNRLRDLNLFFFIVIGLSLIATFNGIKQLEFGMSAAEQAFINGGGYRTHVLFGKLRVFSFYSDAGNFGASQAHIAIMALILSFGPFKWWKRVLLMLAAGLSFYGMLISGTRGAFFVLVVGVAIALFLSKNVKVLIIGSALALCGLFVLKYTSLGNGNYHIHRLRTALNPEDASLNVRLDNQAKLAEYLSTRPFGGGVGSIGHWAHEYNKGTFLSKIAPDSYWVKVWAMYGIVGFTIWMGMMTYILGKCCGIVWNIRSKALRIKLMALTAGAGGILVCSYGNEVMNAMPSAILLYASWAFVFLGPKLDRENFKLESHV